jgi:demethylmenaquinone methyltransferase / 2-methoxy-6-polyprenyl-1,4-benzoquinol methylase
VTQTLIDKRGDRIRRMFGRIAPWYDTLNHLLSLNIDRRWRRRTTELVPPAADGPILDLCTGTGDLALAYDRAAGGNLPVVGADFCPEMLALAARKADRAGAAGRVTFVEADAQDLPFPADHFQLVSCAFGLRNVADTDRGLAEMVRVVRPGGRVAVLEFSKPTAPVLGRAYLWYFRRVLPRIGQLLSRSPDSAYSYLPASVLAFPDGEAMAEKLREHGLVNVRYYPVHPGNCDAVRGGEAAARWAAR